MSFKCRYCDGLKQWYGNAPLPRPLVIGDKGLTERHCGFEGAKWPRYEFLCPICFEPVAKDGDQARDLAPETKDDDGGKEAPQD